MTEFIRTPKQTIRGISRDVMNPVGLSDPIQKRVSRQELNRQALVNQTVVDDDVRQTKECHPKSSSIEHLSHHTWLTQGAIDDEAGGNRRMGQGQPVIGFPTASIIAVMTVVEK